MQNRILGELKSLYICINSTTRIAITMFNTFYKLMFEPFAEVPYSKFFWIGENQKAALGGMKNNILANSQGVILLIGDEGQGKSTLIDILINRIKEHVNFGRIRKDDDEERTVFLEKIARSMGLRATASQPDFFSEFTEHLIRLYTNSGKNSLLILENGQALTQEILDDLAQISSITVSGRKIVNFLLVGDKHLLEAIEYSADTTLRQSLLFLCKTNSLSKQDTVDYISHRLKIAGNSNPIFTDDAITEIYRRARGNLNTINEICTDAISLGTLRKKELIDADIILEACSTEPAETLYADKPVQSAPTTTPQSKGSDRSVVPLSFPALRLAPLYGSIALCSLVLLFFIATFIADKKAGQYPVQSMLAGQIQSSTTDPQTNSNAIKQTEVTTDTDKQVPLMPARKSIAARVQDNSVLETTSPGQSSAEIAKDPAPELIAQINNMVSTASGTPIEQPDITSVVEAEESSLTSFDESMQHFTALKKKKLYMLPGDTIVLQAKPNSDMITDEAMEQLEKFTRTLVLSPERKILIEGYIASKNDTPANTALSQRRADLIRQTMIKLGAQPDQLQAVGRGNHNPITSNNTSLGRQKNRRIEISVIGDTEETMKVAHH